MSEETLTESLSHDECTKILANYLGPTKNGKLIDFKLVPELETVGYLGDYYHLHLNYKIENDDSIQKIRLFVKSVFRNNIELNFYMEKLDILRKEALLYEKLLNKLREYSHFTWCAECYYIREDLFIMQNIPDLGYEPIEDTTAFLNDKQLKAMLQGLAIMHSSSIAYEVKHNKNIGEEFDDILYEVSISSRVDWYTTGLKTVFDLIAMHPTYQSLTIKEVITKQLPDIFENVYGMVNPSTKYRNVFSHRDAWGGNIFLQKNQLLDAEIPAVFVDFQLCRYSPPAIDVLMALYLNLEPKIRRSKFDEYCQYYYKHFVNELQRLDINAEEHMSESIFNESIKEMQLFGALYNSMAATILRVPDSYLKNLKTNSPEAYHRYANIDRTADVLELMRTNVQFREYLLDCITDIMELVL